MATAVSRFESAIASINKSGHSGKPFEFFCISVPDGRAGMSGLDEYLNLVKDDDAKKAHFKAHYPALKYLIGA